MLADQPGSTNESFRLLAEMLPQLVVVADRDGNTVYANRRFLTYTGLSVNDTLETRLDVYHPEDRVHVRQAWQRAMFAAEAIELEVRVREASTRTFRWHLLRSVPVRSANEKNERWYATLTDIDDQKRAEEVLERVLDVQGRLADIRDPKAALQVLAEAAVHAFADWCSIYTSAVDGAVEIAAIAHKDAAKIALARRMARRYPASKDPTLARVIESGEAVLVPAIDDAMLRESSVDPEHYAFIASLGMKSVMIVPLQHGALKFGAMVLVSSESGRNFSKRDLQLAATFADRAATAYRTALLLDEVLQTEERLRQLIEVVPPMIWISRPRDGGIVDVNRRWLDYFGISREEGLNWSLRHYAHPEDFHRANDLWKRSLTEGTPYEIEYRLRNAEGAYHWFLARGAPVRDRSGEIVQWIGSATDIDAQKREMEQTRRIADSLAQAFLPRRLPQTPVVEFDAAYRPAELEAQVGGDWYDAFELDDGTIVFSIGDVAGHGLEAAVTMAHVRQAILGASVDTADPATVLEKVNRIVCLQRFIMATALVGFIRKRRVTYATAGHPPAVLANANGAAFLQHGGMPLGVGTDTRYVTYAIDARPGDVLVTYTDGITEASRCIDEAEQRLLKAASEAATGPLDAAAVCDAVLQHQPSTDDAAVMLLRFQ